MSTDLLELDNTGSRKVEMFVARYFGGLEAGTCVQISAPTEDCGWGYVQINKKDWEVLRPVIDQAFGFNAESGSMNNCTCSRGTWKDEKRTEICKVFEDNGIGMCMTCMHDKECHGGVATRPADISVVTAEGLAQIKAAFGPDWKALAGELAEALSGLVDNAWAACEEENGELVGRATQEEWDAHCTATDNACAALAKYDCSLKEQQEKGV